MQHLATTVAMASLFQLFGFVILWVSYSTNQSMKFYQTLKIFIFQEQLGLGNSCFLSNTCLCLFGLSLFVGALQVEPILCFFTIYSLAFKMVLAYEADYFLDKYKLKTNPPS